MLAQDIAEIKDGKIITKDGRTVDQIYKGFQLYKSGEKEFTATKEKDKYEGSLDDVKRQIDKYWEKKDAEEVLKKKTSDDGDKLKYGPYKGKSIKETPDDYVGHLYQNAPIGSSAYKEAEKILKDRGVFKKWEKYSADSKSTTDALDPDEIFDIRDIEKETKANDYFRKVLFTAERMQLVLMCLKPGEDIGEEVHPTTDQFFRIEEGSGKTVVDGKEINITDGSSILIKSGRVHNIINNSNKPLRLYSLYSPPQHRDGLIQKEK